MLKAKHLIYLGALALTTFAFLHFSNWTVPSDRAHTKGFVKPVCELELIGQIRAEMIKKIQSNDCPFLKLKITSQGGEEKVSRQLAHEIAKRNVEIYVDSLCLSACAEYLLPAATTIKFDQFPLVGFHGNPLVNEFFIKHYKPKGYLNCTHEEAKLFKSLYIDKNINPEFWTMQLQKLVVQNVEFATKENSCPIVKIDYKYDFWFPESKTLRNRLGIKFNGKTCADLRSCGKRQLEIFFKQGLFLVGSTTHSLHHA